VCANKDVEDLSIFRRLMEVNYYGCVDCTHFALPFLKKSTHAKILVISSLAGKGGVPHRSGYCASKFALHGTHPTTTTLIRRRRRTLLTVACRASCVSCGGQGSMKRCARSFRPSTRSG
jgi:NAD(P)-dependent dehydrogenase (short-subunit alcohol dehydrogenase family)